MESNRRIDWSREFSKSICGPLFPVALASAMGGGAGDGIDGDALSGLTDGNADVGAGKECEEVSGL